MRQLLTPLFLLFVMLLPAIAAYATTVEYRPPASARPIVREPGSNGVSYGCPANTKSPVLLMPGGHIGQTIAAHPTFYAFVPAAASVQFTVVEPGAGGAVYVTNFAPKQDGIVRLPLPASGPALKLGKTYWWYLSVLCDPKYGRDRSYLQGWVQRVNPTPQLRQQLKQSTAGDRPALYATSGLWYDALDAIARQQQTSQAAQGQMTWKQWLQPFKLDDRPVWSDIEPGQPRK